MIMRLKRVMEARDFSIEKRRKVPMIDPLEKRNRATAAKTILSKEKIAKRSTSPTIKMIKRTLIVRALTENNKRSIVPLRSRVGLNISVPLSVKETIEGAAAVGVLIVTEVLPAIRKGTGNHVIIIVITIVTIIAIIIKETPRHQREELLSRVAVTVQAVNKKGLMVRQSITEHLKQSDCKNIVNISGGIILRICT